MNVLLKSHVQGSAATPLSSKPTHEYHRSPMLKKKAQIGAICYHPLHPPQPSRPPPPPQPANQT